MKKFLFIIIFICTFCSLYANGVFDTELLSHYKEEYPRFSIFIDEIRTFAELNLITPLQQANFLKISLEDYTILKTEYFDGVSMNTKSPQEIILEVAWTL